MSRNHTSPRKRAKSPLSLLSDLSDTGCTHRPPLSHPADPFPIVKGAEDPHQEKNPTPPQHCLVPHQTQGHGTGAFPAFLRGPEPRGRHPPPRVREGEQSSRGAAIHYLAYGACSIE